MEHFTNSFLVEKDEKNWEKLKIYFVVLLIFSFFLCRFIDLILCRSRTLNLKKRYDLMTSPAWSLFIEP